MSCGKRGQDLPFSLGEESPFRKKGVSLGRYRESLYGLFLLVRTVRVVRGSCFSSRVFFVILTAKHAKTANKKGSVRCRFEPH